MMRRALPVVFFDLLALGILYFVLQDLASRESYIQSEQFTSTTAYSLFTRFFTIQGGTLQVSLASPPALDWVQVVIASLIVVNGLYLFLFLRRSFNRSPSPPR